VKTIAEIKAARLQAALDESCCGTCHKLSKEKGKKVCCGESDDMEEVKPAPVSKGAGGEHHTSAFVQRCVAALHKKDPDQDTSAAFGICKSQEQKSPGAAKEKSKEGVSAGKVKDYESALKTGRQQRTESLGDRIVAAVLGA